MLLSANSHALGGSVSALRQLAPVASPRPVLAFTPRPSEQTLPETCSTSSRACAVDQQARPSQRRGRQVVAQAAENEVMSQEELMGRAAQDLEAFCNSLPELSEEVQGLLANSIPGLVSCPPEEVRALLEQTASALEVSMESAAKLIARIPAVGERPPEALAQKLQPFAAALGVPMAQVVDLLISQPGLWNINHPTIIKDRLDTLATRLGIPLATMVQLIGRQPLLWVVQPTTMANTVQQVGDRLGLSYESALDLVARMPVVLVLEPKLLQLSVQGLCATTGLSQSKALELLTRSLGLAALPCDLLASSLEQLAADLQVSIESVTDLLIKQPMVLCAQPTSIARALEMLCAALNVDQAQALRVLCEQPSLLYDVTIDTLVSRLEALAPMMNTTQDATREAALRQPALLVLSPPTVRSTISALGMRTGASLADCLSAFLDDPGAFVLMGYMDNVVDAWSGRLQVEPGLVSELLTRQPALLDVTANTVKARLESVSALFGVPLEISAQLALKHAALLAIPPNATITRVKNLSTALRLGMQTAGTLMAKEPGVLGVAAHNAGELRAHAEAVSEIIAVYEYYTMEWLQKQAKEVQPARVRSFSSIHS